MARKNKQKEDVAVVVPDPAPEEELPLPLRRIGRIHQGIIVRIPCPLYPATEDSPALVVGFRVDNLWRVINERPTPVEGGDGEEYRRYIAAIAPVWEGWDFLDALTGEPIPAPNPQNLDTYKVLDTMPDIAQWAVAGYQEALEQLLKGRLGPNGGRG